MFSKTLKVKTCFQAKKCNYEIISWKLHIWKTGYYNKRMRLAYKFKRIIQVFWWIVQPLLHREINLHMWLWDWHFYHSCLHIDRRIIFWILKNSSDTLKRTPKVISNENLFSRFQSWWWSDWPWKLWGCSVFHYSRVGLMLPLSVRKWPNLAWQPPFLHQISTLLLLEVGD